MQTSIESQSMRPRNILIPLVAVLLSIAVPYTVLACKTCGTIDPQDDGHPNYINCDGDLPHCNDTETGKQSCDYNPDYGGGLVHINCDVVGSNGQITGQGSITAMNCQAFGSDCP